MNSELTNQKQELKEENISKVIAADIFRVIPALMQIIRNEMRLSVEGLTIPKFRILARLNMGPTNPHELAEWIGVSLPAISRMLNLLEDQDLIVRDRNSDDRRCVGLSLTPKGLQLFKRFKTIGQNSLANRFEALSAADKKSLLNAIRTLEFAIEQSEDPNEKVTCTGTSRKRAGVRTISDQ